MILQESVIKKAIDYAKNNKGKLLAGAAGLAALGGAAYYAKEHGGLENTFNQLKDKFTGNHSAPAAPAAPKPEKPEAPKAPAAAAAPKPEKPEAPKAAAPAAPKPEKPEAPKAAAAAAAPKPEKPEAPKPASKPVPKYSDPLEEKMVKAAQAGDVQAAAKYAKEYKDEQINTANSTPISPEMEAEQLKEKMNAALKNGDTKDALKYSKELMKKFPDFLGNSEPDEGEPDIEPRYKYNYNPNPPAYKANWRNLRTPQN